MGDGTEKAREVERRAVCFEPQDYAGLIRRLIIVCIDLAAVVAILLGLVVAAGFGWFALFPEARDLPPALLPLVLVLTAYVYLTVVKRSRIGSPGYLLTGVRIVDVEGRRPSMLRMTVRFFLLAPLPWGLILDLGWLLDERTRQTFRDKWAGTFVVRRKAKPIGRVPIRYKRVGLAGLLLVVPEPDFTHHDPVNAAVSQDGSSVAGATSVVPGERYKRL